MSNGGRPRKPAYKVGHVKGDLTVIAHAGRFIQHPDVENAKVRTRESHYYKVRCTCGTEEIVDQASLHRSDTRSCCRKCSSVRRGERVSKTKLAKSAGRPPKKQAGEKLPPILELMRKRGR